MERVKYLKQKYHLEQHTEGGWFAEVYTAPFSHENRPLMGSIYLLQKILIKAAIALCPVPLLLNSPMMGLNLSAIRR